MRNARAEAFLREVLAVVAAGWPQYGTSMHYPSCLVGGCTGCLPPLTLSMPAELEPYVDPHRFDAVRAEAFRRVPDVR